MISHRLILSVAIFVGLALTVGCAKKRRQATNPGDTATRVSLSGDEKTGYASWYGHPYHGRRTSNGETYDMNTLTAAHRTLAFDTVVKVSNLENGRDVTVRINDRGPFVKDRIIDLSYAAAKQIKMVGPGMAKVSLEVLKAVANPFPLSIQVASFQDEKNAKRLQKQLKEQFSPVFITKYAREEGLFYRVLAGRYKDPEQAKAALRALRTLGYQGLLVRLDFSTES
jgi:rare lipoprotein A